MNINPANATAMYIARPDKRNYLVMRHGAGLEYLLISTEELVSTSAIADQKFPVH